MTRRRWIADEVVGDRAALTGAHAAHLSRVLRVQLGQDFDVVCGESVRRGTVASVADERVEFVLGQEVAARVPVPITLLLAVFKFDRMEWAIEKCTELNATTIIPVIARRTEKHLAQAAGKRVERWRRIGLEASQQSRRDRLPEIEELVPFDDVLTAKAACRFVCEEEAGAPALLASIPATRSPDDTVAVLIGPEGGWTETERSALGDSGWTAVSLGPQVLRAETAAIAVLAILSAAWLVTK